MRPDGQSSHHPLARLRPQARRGVPRWGILAFGLFAALIFSACGSSETSERGAAVSEQVRSARVLRDQGRMQEALAAYDVALRNDPRDSVALVESCTVALAGGRLQDAKRRAEAVLQQVPDSAVAYLVMARIAFKQGDRREAGRILDQVAGSQPDDPLFYLPAARLYQALARPERGAEVLELARAKGLADAEQLGFLGDLYIRISRPGRAVDAYRAAVDLEPASLDFYRGLGRSLLLTDRNEEAEAAFQAALQIHPEDPYTLYYLGSIQLEEGRAAAAIDFLQRSLRQDEYNPKARYALGRALQKMGREEEARVEFEKHAELMKKLFHRREGGAVEDPARREIPEGSIDWVDWGQRRGEEVPGSRATPSPNAPSRFYFVDVAQSAGVHLRNVSGSLRKDYIVESLGSGACWLDYDLDQDLDLFLVNGQPMAPQPEAPPSDALYQNQGDGTFMEVTSAAGIRDTGWGHGCAVGDIDNDGDPDLFVTNRGANALFLNLGNGAFTEVGEAAGLADPGWGTSAAFADYDQDGLIDLVVANYVEFDPANTPRPGSTDSCRFLGMPVFCGPRGLPPARDRLYRNLGGGRFEDVTEKAGLHLDQGFYSLAVAWGDLDNDADLDLYLATDSTRNLLYRNNGNGTFDDISTVAGVAYNDEGREQAGMGVDFGDYDRDEDLDIVVSNFSHDSNALYRQEAPGLFQDVSYVSRMGEPSLSYLGWGVAFVDLDQDGWLDIFVANGHIQPQIDGYDLGSSYRERNLLFANRGDGTFEEVGRSAGPGMTPATPSRSAAFADFDNDGDLDILINNIDEVPNLLQNERTIPTHWIGFKLVGSRGNRDAYGARVILAGPDGPQLAEVSPGNAYLSSRDPRLLFGLGPRDLATSGQIRIRWPDGREQVLDGLPVDRYHTLTEPAD